VDRFPTGKPVRFFTSCNKQDDQHQDEQLVDL